MKLSVSPGVQPFVATSRLLGDLGHGRVAWLGEDETTADAEAWEVPLGAVARGPSRSTPAAPEA